MPPPSRERLSRPVDISTLFRGAARTVDLKVDEPGLRWAGLSGDPTRRISSSPSSRARRSSRRTFGGGPENRTPGRTTRSGRGRGRGRGRVLPHWYPRTPLRDITAIVRVIVFMIYYMSDSGDQGCGLCYKRGYYVSLVYDIVIFENQRDEFAQIGIQLINGTVLRDMTAIARVIILSSSMTYSCLIHR